MGPNINNMMVLQDVPKPGEWVEHPVGKGPPWYGYTGWVRPDARQLDDPETPSSSGEESSTDEEEEKREQEERDKLFAAEVAERKRNEVQPLHFDAATIARKTLLKNTMQAMPASMNKFMFKSKRYGADDQVMAPEITDLKISDRAETDAVRIDPALQTAGFDMLLKGHVLNANHVIDLPPRCTSRVYTRIHAPKRKWKTVENKWRQTNWIRFKESRTPQQQVTDWIEEEQLVPVDWRAHPEKWRNRLGKFELRNAREMRDWMETQYRANPSVDTTYKIMEEQGARLAELERLDGYIFRIRSPLQTRSPLKTNSLSSS